MPRNQYEDLERQILDPDDDEDEGEQEQARPVERANRQMRRLPVWFVRVPVSWFDGSDPRPYPFDGERGRLFLFLLHLSRWGQRPVTLTSAVTAQLGQPRWNKSRHLKRLEADGWVHVARDGHKAVVVRPIVRAG